jgi:hypothetical protein
MKKTLQYACFKFLKWSIIPKIIFILFTTMTPQAQTILGSQTSFWIQAENGPTNGGVGILSGTADGWNNLVANPTIPNINTLVFTGASPSRTVIDGDLDFNYNSTMNLNEAAFNRDGLSNTAVTNNNRGTMFVVASTQDLTFNYFYTGALAPGHRSNTGFRVLRTDYGGSGSLATPAPVAGRANVMGYTAHAGTPSHTNRMNGASASNASATARPVGFTANAYTLSIGSFPGFCMTGKVAEAFAIRTNITATQLNQIDSYLAIKYGVTLSHDYLASNAATTVYALDPIYRNNIIGIARDLAFGGLVSGGGSAIAANTLLQKQSHNFDDSVRIYKGTLHPTTNRLNASTFTQDISYVVMGADNGKLRGTFSEMPIGLLNCDLYSRLEREWKVTKTNFGGAEMFNWDVKLSNIGAPGSVNVAELRLLVDDDGDFSNGGTQCYFNGDGTGIVISYSNPTITVSNISDIHIPNNGTKYITLASISITTPLPIELLDFNLKCIDGSNHLSWQTFTGTSVNSFEVERSTVNEDWQAIAEIYANENTHNYLMYSYEDRLELPIQYYYRLKLVDIDGNSKYSPVLATSIEACSMLDDIDLYPNPANDNISFTVLSSLATSIHVEIQDLSGRIVFAENLSKEQCSVGITTTYFSEGTYLFKAKINDKLVIKRIVIKH